jgi:hypothetical protein
MPSDERRRRRRLPPAGALLLAALAACGGSPTGSTPASPPVPASTPVPSGPDPILVAAGDIAACGHPGAEATARVLDSLFPADARPERGVVATVGDNAYPSGTLGEFMACYDPTWGRHRARTHPAAGNHEYLTPGAAGYFAYFGAAAGEPGRGYYSYDVGTWHVVVLNTNCAEVGGCGTSSPQLAWLRADLAAHPTACAIACLHHPRFSSGVTHGSQPFVGTIWETLQLHGVDVVLSGHEHHYERFAPQDASGRADAGRGIREFVVGTGGAASLYPFGSPQPNSEVRASETYGVLELTLRPVSYEWRFLYAAGVAFTDAGQGTCH